ncbi:hypothetical protein EJ08DRAFT_241603 [Tothia fuscella]|uniref:Fork-head domain-containing protein n=1 Tax=Tothia fuscella TaxID=1048955 RepID=A0A9P4NQU3_9PEZI|nr:hypothetical protein EJ08DRAFT_241603 [Tothia fuscella]
MTSTETGCGEAAPAMSYSTVPEQASSARPSSPYLTPHMAVTNVDTSFNGPHNIPHFNKSSMIMNSGLPFSHGLDHSMMPQEKNNYQICPPQTQSFPNNDQSRVQMSCSPSDMGYSPQSPMFWGGSANDRTRPRSCPDVDFFNSMGALPGPQQYDYVSMYQVQPQMMHTPMDLSMGPTSEPLVRIQDDEMDQSMSHSDVMESIEPCGSAHQHSLFHQSHHDDVKQQSATPFDEEMDTTEDMDVDKSQPYAKSLYRCLKEAPNHTMILRGIYDWFRTNTDKGQDPHERGWQNSIRHNLSMNKAFEKIEVPSGDDPTKRGFQWRLSQVALKAGKVESTTRYRNKQPIKRGPKNHMPAPSRSRSGHLGGEMAKRAAQLRRSERLRDVRAEITESGNLLRSQGVIRGGGPMRQLRGPYGEMIPSSGSPPPRYNGLDYFTSDPNSASHSGPSSPYFLPDDNGGFASSPHHPLEAPLNLMNRSPAFNNESYPSSPELGGHPEFHFMPIGDRVFYDSNTPESASEPRTPNSFTESQMEMQMAPSQFSAPFFIENDMSFGG